MRSDLVSCVGDPPNQIRMPIRDPSKDEEGRAKSNPIQT
jgi:hypothetical protein